MRCSPQIDVCVDKLYNSSSSSPSYSGTCDIVIGNFRVSQKYFASQRRPTGPHGLLKGNKNGQTKGFLCWTWVVDQQYAGGKAEQEELHSNRFGEVGAFEHGIFARNSSEKEGEKTEMTIFM